MTLNLLFSLLFLSSSAFSQETEITTSNAPPWIEKLDELRERGVDINLVYKGDLFKVLSGGVEEKEGYLDNLDFSLGLDLEKLSGLRGATVFLHGLYNSGSDSTAYVGDVQASSNIETSVNATKLYQAWVQYEFNEAWRSLFGIHDLNSEFYLTDSSGEFLNSSFGVGAELAQTGENGPAIFPSPSFGVFVAHQVNEHLTIQAAIYDATAGDPGHPSSSEYPFHPDDGYLLIGEMSSQRDEGLLRKIAFGYWTYTKESEYIASDSIEVEKKKNAGFYGVCALSLSEDFEGFLRFGVADEEVNAFKSNFVAGLVWQETVGLGVSQLLASQSGESETAYEIYYRWEVLPHVALKPDLQYIQNPGFESSDIEDATIGYLRLEASL